MKPHQQNNPKVFGDMLKRIVEINSRYYVDANCEIQLYWNGGWKPYDYVAERDSRFIVNAE